MEVPQNIEAEKNLLGAIIVYNDKLFEAEQLDVLDFYNVGHQKIFKAMRELSLAGEGYEVISLADKIGDSVKLSYLVGLTNQQSFEPIKKLVEIIKDCSIRRQLMRALDDSGKIIQEDGKEISEVLAGVQDKVTKISLQKTKNDSSAVAVEDLIELQAEHSQKLEEGKKYLGLESGIGNIDRAISGIRPSHLWVIGGWSGTGKSSFALNIIHNVLKQKIPCSIVSLEMGSIDILARLIAIRHNINSHKVLQGLPTNKEFELVEEGKDFFWKAPLQIHTDYFSLEEIKMSIRRDVHIHGSKVVLLDYIQQVISLDREYEVITETIKAMQQLAKVLGITILVVSQISNEAQKGRSAGGGFKGSGQIEASADLAIRLNRDKTKEMPEWESIPIEIQVVKNKHGFDGSFRDWRMWLASGLYQEFKN